MKRLIFSSTMLLTAALAQAALTFSGPQSGQAVSVQPEASSGLNQVWVLPQFDGVDAIYEATSDRTVNVYRYSNLGGGYAEPVAVSKNGRRYSIKLTGTADMGYIVEEGTTRSYYWLVNYAAHPLSLTALGISPEADCERTALIPSGVGDRMVYYSINGRQIEIDRQITVSYNTLQYNEDNYSYGLTSVDENLTYLPATIYVDAPLCDTYFVLSGDRFLRSWGSEQSVSSSYFNTNAIEAQTWAIETEHEYDNEKHEETGGQAMGGSGPVEITFGAAVTDAAIFKEWQMSHDPEFNDITFRHNDTDFTYTFDDTGTTYVRFAASNAAGDCNYYGTAYEVFVGESRLDCPNAFSPGASEGVNDEWKVSYKSIVDFECHIFNRWGTKIIDLTHPSQGWDGKHNGKLVPPGVYFYVIKATGADGKKYNLGGDINVIRYKQNSVGTGDPIE